MLLSYTNVELVCDGIDTISEISINGKRVGETMNQFIQYKFPVKDYIQQVSFMIVC